MSLKGLNILLAWMLLSALPTLSLASKPDSLGYSASGLGHVTTMNGRSSTLAAANPAGLLQCSQKAILQGYTLTHFAKQIQNQTTRVQLTRGFEGGLCLPSTIFSFDSVIGLTWFLPDQHITSLRTQAPRGPTMVYFEDRLDRLAIVSSLALGQRDSWGLGFGLEHLATTLGTIKLRGELLLDENQQPSLDGDIDFLFRSKRRLLGSLWLNLTPSVRWGIGYAGPLGLTVDLDLDFEGDVSSAPGVPLLEDVSLLLESHLYAYGTPSKWTTYLLYLFKAGELALEVSLVDWSGLEVPLPTSVVSTSLREEESGLPVQDNPMQEIFQVSLGFSSAALKSEGAGLWRLHSGIRFEQALVSSDQSTIIDVPKLHLGAAVEAQLSQSSLLPILGFGVRYVQGLQATVASDNQTYGTFNTNLWGISTQLDLEWQW